MNTEDKVSKAQAVVLTIFLVAVAFTWLLNNNVPAFCGFILAGAINFLRIFKEKYPILINQKL